MQEGDLSWGIYFQRGSEAGWGSHRRPRSRSVALAPRVNGMLPLWAFALLCLDAYARMALVSIQEFFGFSYTSFKAQLAIYELGPAAVVLVATFFYASSMKLMPF